MSVKLVKIF